MSATSTDKLKISVWLFFFAYLICFYPGFMSYDSLDQYTQAINSNYSDLHPPFMAFLWHYTNYIIHGPFGMLIVQCALYAIGAYFIAKNITLKSSKSALFKKIFFCSILFFAPPIFSINGTIWKDILMVAFLLPAFAVIYSLFQQSSTQQAAQKAVLSLSLLLCAAAARHNAITAEPALVWLLIVGLYRAYAPNTKMIMLKSLLFAMPLTGFIFASSVAIDHTITNQKAHASQMVQLFDLAGMVRFSDNQQIIDTKTAQDLQPIINPGRFNSENIYKYYDPTNWIKMTSAGLYQFTSDRKKLSLLHHVWLTSILHHTHAYLTHRYEVYRHMLGLGNTVTNSEIYDASMSIHTLQDPQLPQMYEPAKIIYNPSWLQLKISHYLHDFIKQNYTRIFFKPWFYILVGFLMLGYLGIKRNSYQLPAVMLIISGLTYNFAYFILAPSNDYRYSNWTVITVFIAILLTFMQDKQTIENKNSEC